LAIIFDLKEFAVKSLIDFESLKFEFANCSCGIPHSLVFPYQESFPGLVHHVGEILLKQTFPRRLLLVADCQTLQASTGILESLREFSLKKQIYEDVRLAELCESERIQQLASDSDGILAVGTGSIHDICRYAAATIQKPLCLFATAPSMDGFASYNAALTHHQFKETYAAKTPEIILADTTILANSPAELKAAGFGDMVAKYVALIDWQVAHLLIDEPFCPKVARLTRMAADHIMSLAKQLQTDNEESAQAVFEGLLLTGIGMGLTKTSRPASGTEHILSHFWECQKLLEGKMSDFHGKKVGVATLLIMKKYAELAEIESVSAVPEQCDWKAIYQAYGPLAKQVKAINFPKTITKNIDPQKISDLWPKIREIIRSVPSVEEIRQAMIDAGCALTTDEIGISDTLRDLGLAFHPYMRHRLSLYRLLNMIDA
jgi:glycerol-1-phosphate dehydrogenase [NAD(P)+]